MLSPGRELWRLTGQGRGRISRALAAMALANLCLFGVPLLTKGAIDGLFSEGGPELDVLGRLVRELEGALGLVWTLALGGLATVLLTALAALGQYLRARWVASATEDTIRGLRDRLYSRLEHGACGFHDAHETGDLVQRCTSDVETLRVFLSDQLIEIARTVLMALMVVPVLLWLDPTMTAVSLALVPVITLTAFLFFRWVQALFLQSDEDEGAMTAVLQENLSGIRVVRAFARQDFECEKFAAKNAALRDSNRRLLEALALFWSLSDALCFLQIGLALFAGAAWVESGRLSVGSLVAFLSLLSLLIWPIRHLGRVLSETGKALVALGRLGAILHAEPESGGMSEPGAAGRIELVGARFAYQEGCPVLRGLDLVVEAGETLAIVGPPGAGKSTLIALLMRFYELDAGSILLDGVDIRGLDLAALRRRVAVAFQEPFLFSQSLGENIRFGKPEAGEAAVAEASRRAAVASAIAAFPQGFDTRVGERGVKLSGGQRQRVALARALLKEAPVLILDDVVSAVDTKTEAEILASLEARRGKQTTLLITHRLASLRNADRILVLEEGRLRQLGSHAELMAREGPYRELWRGEDAACAVGEEAAGVRS